VQSQSEGTNHRDGQVSPVGSRYHHSVRQLTGRALEDQRKFREVDEEQSYFDSDDDGPPVDGRSPNSTTAIPPAVDEIDAQRVVERELHRTPRMFSLAQAPLLNNLEESTVSSSTERADANIENSGPVSMDGVQKETEETKC